jgi:ABC-type nitrate/sulfonate/bicarbonate transport system permease component
VDRRLINMARIAGASEAAISREVVWNSLLPFFFASLKIALPRAVSAAIIGEFLVGNEGIGFLIENSRQNFDTTGVFTGVVVATALVLVINALLVWIDRRVSAWRPVERHMEL